MASPTEFDQFVALLELDSDDLSSTQRLKIKQEIGQFLDQYPSFFEHTQNYPHDVPFFQALVLMDYQTKNPSIFIPYEFLIDALHDEREKPFSPQMGKNTQAVMDATDNGKKLSEEERERLQSVVWSVFADQPRIPNHPLLPMLYDLFESANATQKSCYNFFDLLRNAPSESKQVFASYCETKDPSSALSQNTRLVALLDDLKVMLHHQASQTSVCKYQEVLLSLFENYQKTHQEHTILFLKQNISDWLEYLFEADPSSAQSFIEAIEGLPSPQQVFFKNHIAKTWVNTPPVFIKNGGYATWEKVYYYFVSVLEKEDMSSLLVGLMGQTVLAYDENSRKKFARMVEHMTKHSSRDDFPFQPSLFWSYHLPVLHGADNVCPTSFSRLQDSIAKLDPRFLTLLLTVQEVCGEGKISSILQEDCQGFDVPPPPEDLVLYIHLASERFAKAQAIVQSLWEKELLQEAVSTRSPSLPKKM